MGQAGPHLIAQSTGPDMRREEFGQLRIEGGGAIGAHLPTSPGSSRVLPLYEVGEGLLDGRIEKFLALDIEPALIGHALGVEPRPIVGPTHSLDPAPNELRPSCGPRRIVGLIACDHREDGAGHEVAPQAREENARAHPVDARPAVTRSYGPERGAVSASATIQRTLGVPPSALAALIIAWAGSTAST